MGLTKPNQELRRDLKQAAAILKWSGIDLFKVAVRLSEVGLETEARELLRMANSYQEIEDRLAAYSNEVKQGRIVRAKL
ncbi:hypothetical protein C4K04_1641 [Pseudomonas chlororaphis]|uniref:Uncharacterized protein n=1 Tax=Pseudomonas chlororaphis TaxID=587753 RepID=A0A3G7TLX7_9PSED|nr:hypothetical protein [Pseudomonas chlororaphis]AZE47329.1 hypothetical protein C4K04_1641 [Pseudomonas chlororaphis]